jgi:H(+)-translocating pyrophosphatase
MALRRGNVNSGLEEVDLDSSPIGGPKTVLDLEGGGSGGLGSTHSNFKSGSSGLMVPREKDFHRMSTMVLAVIGAFFIVTALMALSLPDHGFILFICTLLAFCAVTLAYFMTIWVMKKDDGTDSMYQVTAAVRQGAEGFFSTQYGTIFRMSLIVALVLGGGYLLRPQDEAQHIGPFAMACVVSMSFLFGAFFSALAGYTGLYICVRANARVAAAAKVSFQSTMKIAMVSGAIPALIVVGLVISGIVFLFSLLHIIFGSEGRDPQEIPLLMVGFGFGASFVALFAQLGGGIFTKAADVGADLVGKVEAGLDEDDPRNPAVVADLVGDNVGDCAGRGADLFESISAEIIAAMILGGSIAGKAALPATGFILFPVLIHGFDLVVSALGLFFAFNLPAKAFQSHNPLGILKAGYVVAIVLASVGFYLACKLLLDFPDDAPQASMNFFYCGLLGQIAALLTVYITQYYTDYIFRPVKDIARASVSGHAMNVITGTAVGMESCALPTLVIVGALMGSYYLGVDSGIVESGTDTPIAGFFGTAVATMGMLSSASFVLTMDFFGPISDNAGGIVEMSGEPDEVREITDLLDAVGNTTKAATKGFAISSAALACFLLFSAFMDEISLFTGTVFNVVDIAQPEVFAGGIIGASLVMLFSSYTLAAVSEAAQELVNEVRRQFRTMPGILLRECPPDYTQCVTIANKAALAQMVKPGLLATLVPVLVGLIFKGVGRIRGDNLLGAKAVAGLLMFSTVTGVMMSLYMNNAGGAWDNAKKLVETGRHGGKNSDAHKATVTGDTVGDPFKDTAGPSLHVFIKLLSTVTLVMAPLFVPSRVVNKSGDLGADGGSMELLSVLGLTAIVVMYFTGTFSRCSGHHGLSKDIDSKPSSV